MWPTALGLQIRGDHGPSGTEQGRASVREQGERPMRPGDVKADKRDCQDREDGLTLPPMLNSAGVKRRLRGEAGKDEIRRVIKG